MWPLVVTQTVANVRYAKWLRSPCSQRCARCGAPSAGRHGLPRRDGYLCRPFTFEHVLAAMCSFARTSDVSLDDGALLNCRTAPKYPNVCFGLHRFCARLFGVSQTGTCRAMDNLLCCRPQRVCPRTRAVVALMLRWLVVARSDRKMKQELQ